MKRNTIAAPDSGHIGRLLALVRFAGLVRSRDLAGIGVPRAYLQRLVDRGDLVQHARGIYGPSGAPITENHSLAQTCTHLPNGVVCLVSALRFHGITTQLPHEVWIAIDRGTWTPISTGTKLRVFHFSGDSMTAGIETHSVEGVRVQVYSVPKTIADCFKFRNKVGLDVAIEALREGWRMRRFTMDELWTHAKVCRVSNVMRPYLEMLP
jgi:predicted transcriptional regulator of viral defense system